MPLGLHREVNVRRPAGIRDRLDRTEVILARRTGEKPPEALEVAIAAFAIAAPRVQIRAVIVDLPDLDQRIAQRLAAGIENRPLRCVISPTAGVMPSLTINRSLSVSSGKWSG